MTINQIRNTCDLDEEVFAVEKILSHRTRNGSIQYLIKWDGFGSEDNSWEDERNVYAPTLIRMYWNKSTKNRSEKKSTKQTKPNSKNKDKIPNKENQNIENSPDDVSNVSNGAINSTRFSYDGSTWTRDASGSQVNDRVNTTNNEDGWENLATIANVFLDYATSQLLMLVIWNDGTKSYHTAQEVHRKCPRQLIKFYEGHLHFENNLQDAN
ncbi:9717_t:CDS:2 [Cetraspora pellucida]|uniref:9717_t:CDS:1 n=1 Tax=Cetraspora pellucida TaxID=1433469 RepID=A0A9N9NGC4_9GLOM|nr:9717_t:CDS:2 [Cetraspora pellucida]